MATNSPPPSGNGQPPSKVTKYSSPTRSIPVGTGEMNSFSLAGLTNWAKRWKKRVEPSGFSMAAPSPVESVMTGRPSALKVMSNGLTIRTLFSGNMRCSSWSGVNGLLGNVSGTAGAGNAHRCPAPKLPMKTVSPLGDTPTSGDPLKSPESRPLSKPDTSRPMLPSASIRLTPPLSSFAPVPSSAMRKRPSGRAAIPIGASSPSATT